jgi:hypothetical protein
VDDDSRALVEQRRQELLAKGYTPGQAALAIDWAKNSAQGMADYFGVDAGQFIERYLKDSENWLRGIGAQA